MRYDKFRGESIQEILMEIRKKYGRNVYILDQKEIKQKGLLGLGIFSKKMYEVQIMIPEEDTPYNRISNQVYNFLGSNRKLSQEFKYETSPNITYQENNKPLDIEKKGDFKDSEKILKEEKKIEADLMDIDSLIQSLQKVKEEKVKDLERQNVFLKKEVEDTENTQAKKTIKMEELTEEEIRALLKEENDVKKEKLKENQILEKKEEISSVSTFKEELESSEKFLLKFREKLIKSEFSEDFTQKFFQIINKKLPVEIERKPTEFYKIVLNELKNFVYYQPEIEILTGKTKAVFFVGPNGSGKTTSLAKIAAKYHLHEKKNISIISLDDYRLAATDQLRIYANILEVPFYCPLNTEEFMEYFYRDSSDLVFIDSSGLSLKDTERLQKIKNYIDKLDLKEVHLVLSAGMRYDLIEKYIKFFNVLPFGKIILTGLDEVNFSGFFIDLADKIKRPYSFLMNGHSVPDDILQVDVDELIELIINKK